MERLVLSRGGLFMVAQPSMDIVGTTHGLYREDTRHLSRWALSIEDIDLRIQRVGARSACEATAILVDAAASISIQRDAILSSHYQERIGVESRYSRPVEIILKIAWGADFRDVFEVRGLCPQRRRRVRVVCEGGLLWLHRGEDGVVRWTGVTSRPRPTTASPRSGAWRISLQPRGTRYITLRVEAGVGLPYPSPPQGHDGLRRGLRALRRAERRRWTHLTAEDGRLQAWIDRSIEDIGDLLLTVNGSRIPAAGIPWFSAPFGRDSLILGLQTVHLNPSLTADILRVMAGLQGRRLDARREEAPGKMMHELRRGELAGAGEIPHTPYYGSVDSTPLFLCLLSEFYAWSGDRVLCEEMYPHALAAADYISTMLEGSPRGFLCYRASEPPGLRHQGWKDSDAGVLFPDGSEPVAPIALCEVQGYAYWGLKGLARIAGDLGHSRTSHRLRRMAEGLRERFNKRFWDPRRQLCALALDGNGQRVMTRTSNPGHLLMTGILSKDRARQVTRRLLEEDMFSGWGLRTMSQTEDLYNPTSYHNGSVWPHDTALASWGMARCGFHEEAHVLFSALMDAASWFPLFRLPELFAGTSRKAGSTPTRVDNACDIQVWAAGAPLIMLRGLLGMEADAPAGKLEVRGRFPRPVGGLRVRGLRVGNARVDLYLRDEVKVRSTAGPEVDIAVL